jgi:excisionase family DNA binding protein
MSDSNPMVEMFRAAVAAELDTRGIRAAGCLPQLIPFAEAATRLGIKPRYLRELIEAGRFPKAVQHTEGGHLMVDARDVEAYVSRLKARGDAAA